jgi:hypothetical protein
MLLRTSKPNPYRQKFALGGLVPDSFLEGFTKKEENFLNQHGDEIITSIFVCRDKLESRVKSLLNTISFGLLDKVTKKLGYDQLFHLYILVNGKYRMEKNETINFASGSKSSDCIPIENIPENLTIAEFVNNAVKKMGKNRFFTYSAFKFNCQDFILGLLQSNGIKAPVSFIDQKASEIVKQLPGYVAPVANVITDLVAALSTARKKLGFERGGLVMG